MITYAGIELGYEDPDGAATAWIEKFLPLADLRDQTSPAATRSQRPASRSGYRPGTSLPILNYPDPPRVKLSTLYWPTGACRWARGYFLAAGQDVAKILATVDDNEPQSLVLKDQDAQVSVTAQMYLLPPRLLTAAEGGDDALWLLPLVDQRYFWQFKAAGELSYTLQSTWANVFNDLQTALAATIHADVISPLYAIPDPDELTRPYENAAVLLDAVAFSVGQTIVCDFDGTVHSMGWSMSAIRWIQNTTQLELVAGGDFSDANPAAAVPESVTVTFTKWREGAVDPTGDLWSEVIPATAPASTLLAEKVIHSAAFADFTSKDPTPDNASEVANLAAIIAGDYYTSLTARYDYVLQSLANAWQPSGFDDFLEFSFGRLHCPAGDDGNEWRAGDSQPEYLTHTRIHSRPYNFGAEEQLQQFTDKPVYPALTRFKLTENLTPLAAPSNQGKSATAVHQKWDTTQSKYVDTTDELTVYDVDNAFPGLDNQYGWAEYKADSLRWEIVSLDNRFAHATLLADLLAGGTSTAEIWALDSGGAEAATGMVVPVRDWNAGPIKIANGQTKVFIRWEVQSSAWYVIGPAGSTVLLGLLATDLYYGESGPVTIFAGPPGAELANGQVITATNYLPLINRNEWVFVAQRDSGLWVIVNHQWEGRLLAKTAAPFRLNDRLLVHLYTGFPGGEVDSGIALIACNKFRNYIAEEKFVWISTNGVIDPGEGGWYIVAGPSRTILGKTQDNIDNGDMGTVNVYGGSVGSEVSNGDTIEAENKFFGYVPNNVWVLCVDDGDGFYIASTRQGDHLYCKVETISGSTATIHGVDSVVTCTIQDDDAVNNDLGIEINAWVRFRPVFEGERVLVVWTGNAFTIVQDSYAVIQGDYFGAAKLAKGSASSSFHVLIGGASKPISSGTVSTPLGDLDSGKKVMIARNRDGLAAISAEC